MRGRAKSNERDLGVWPGIFRLVTLRAEYVRSPRRGCARSADLDPWAKQRRRCRANAGSPPNDARKQGRTEVGGLAYDRQIWLMPTK